MPVEWFPEPLTAACLRGFQASLPAVAADASANSPDPDQAGAVVVPTGPTSAVLKPTGLGPIFEEGARPHDITGTKGFLYLGNGQFVSGTVHHPGSAPKPYLGPAAQRWANGECQAAMRVSCAASGF